MPQLSSIVHSIQLLKRSLVVYILSILPRLSFWVCVNCLALACVSCHPSIKSFFVFIIVQLSTSLGSSGCSGDLSCLLVTKLKSPATSMLFFSCLLSRWILSFSSIWAFSSFLFLLFHVFMVCLLLCSIL